MYGTLREFERHVVSSAHRGFTDIAARIAIRGLERMGSVESFIDSDPNEDFAAYRVTDGGPD